MISRRQFVCTSLAIAFGPMLARSALADTVVIRPSWDVFKRGPLYQVFLNTVRTMRANKNANDANSWFYWANVHQNYCPHGRPYFLAWHRGYLQLFEAQLRKLSNNASLLLPYWDYYTDPTMPVEFTSDPSSPLYIGGRASNSVRGALTLAPFADSVKQFQRGLPNAFEPSIESLPHNQVHNLIGGIMANLQSPQDPIFWLHHANIDRLWAAWTKAANGRHMPPPTDAYWSSDFTYATGVTMPRVRTISTTGLGYNYENESMPDKLPKVEAPVRPQVRKLKALQPRTLAANAFSLGGGAQLSLDQNSVSVEVPLAKQMQPRVQSLIAGQPAAQNGYTSIRVVLDKVVLTELGKKGGYFYKVYIDLPEGSGSSLGEEAYFIGTVGAFEIAGLQHHADHGANEPEQLVFPVTEALKHIAPEKLDKLSVSFIRVDGDKAAVKGAVINIGEFRVEASNSPQE